MNWILTAAVVTVVLIVGDTAEAQRRVAKRKAPVGALRTNVSDSREPRNAGTVSGERLGLGGGDWERTQRQSARGRRRGGSIEEPTLSLGGNDFERTKRPARRRRQ